MLSQYHSSSLNIGKIRPREKSKDMTGIYGGVGGGAVALVITIAVIAIIMLRKRTRKKSKGTNFHFMLIY